MAAMDPFYTPDNYSQQESIGYLLSRARSLFTANLDRALAAYGLTHAQYGIFRKLLDSAGEMTSGDLAREWCYDAGAMTRMLDRLEEKDFIRRRRSDTDRRVVHVQLSDKGRTLANDLALVAMDTLNHHLRGFSMEEVEQFKNFLRRMIANA